MKRCLEIGPGEHPLPGFESLNICENGFSQYIANASGALPISDDIFDLVYASHILEHIPWYKVESTLCEWIRILKPGGHLEVWVPDAFKIASTLVKYETNGVNETYKDGWYRFNPDKDPCVWAAGRLYTYGDGTGDVCHWNWHRALFTPIYLRKLFKIMNLENIRQLNNSEVRGYDHGWISLGFVGTKPVSNWTALPRTIQIGENRVSHVQKSDSPSKDNVKHLNPNIVKSTAAPPADIDIGSLWQGPQWSILTQYKPAQLTYRSVADLNRLIIKNISKFSQFDVVIGIPRSGMVPASIIGLLLNIPVVSFEAFQAGLLSQKYSQRVNYNQSFTKINTKTTRYLVVDDSCYTGATVQSVKKDIESLGLGRNGIFKYLSIYVNQDSIHSVDIALEVVEQPRIFEWNLFHHSLSRTYCIDLDGVLCEDPPSDLSDDLPEYRQYILTAPPKIIPTSKIGAVVTARLEKFRVETAEWLSKNGVQYGQLIMIDLPSGAERRRLGVHTRYKAHVMNTLNALVFIESEDWQAKEIARISRRSVYCTENATMF